MKNQTKTYRFSKNLAVLVLFIAIIAGGLFVIGAQYPAQAVASARTTQATAEQDLRMVMQEQERERLDQANANALAEQMSARIVAAQDLRMVMQESERERIGQFYANSFDASAVACYELRPSCDR